MNKGINVLSLFDGMSATQIALERSNIKVSKYYASEVDKYSIAVTQANYPSTIQLGSVTVLSGQTVESIKPDLLVGGSPCQGFSVAGKKMNFNDTRSKLFWDFVRVLKVALEVNPEMKFILENVKMKQEWQDVISDALGVKPVMINSNLVSAQNRKRLYWTNIPNIEQPEDKGIMLKDIVHEGWFTEKEKSNPVIASVGRTTAREYIQKKQGQMVHTPLVDRDKSHCLDANYWKGGNFKSYFEKNRRQLVFETLNEYIVPFDDTLKILDKEVERGKVGYFRKDSQANRVYYVHGKAVTLYGDAGGGSAKMGQYLFGCITPNRINKRQNGQRFSDGRKFYTLTAQDQHGILVEGYIRKLTPTECERLQTVPDGYTAHVSNTQRYKMLGNGFTVDVICHLLKGAFNG